MSNVSGHDPSRRKFIKKLVYVPPAVLTLSAVPSYATTGSPRSGEHDSGEHDKGGDYSGNKHGSHGRKGRRGWFHRFLSAF